MAEAVFILIGIFAGGLIVWLITRSRASDPTEGLKDTFKAVSAEALESNQQLFINLAQQTLKTVLEEAKGDLGKRQEAIDGMIKPLQQALSRYEAQIQELEKTRKQDYGGLQKHLESLTKVTASLDTALKTPQIRGQWGQVQLKRVIEMTGMSRYCDFTEQARVQGESSWKIPDVVVRLPGECIVVIDAKVPLTAYMEAMETENEEKKAASLSRHAQAIRKHMKDLSQKEYQNQFPKSPDFIVMFLPGESILYSALEYDQRIIDEGFSRKVLLATPTTLIALLNTVALGWKEHEVEENSRKISDAGSDLFDRIVKFAGHLEGIRDGLGKAVKSYNEAVGSWEKRVVPGARKMKELGASQLGRELPDAEPVETSLRELPSREEDD